MSPKPATHHTNSKASNNVAAPDHLIDEVFEHENSLEELLHHPDFAEIRADSTLWEAATLADGLR